METVHVILVASGPSSVLETANSWPPMCTSTLQMVKLGVLESMPLLVLRYATLLYVYGSWRGVRT